ncbi:MAG TPA: hypothetical protein VM820_10770 [Vicinamibacterales bacterium]|jgi:hypothetical protein|nr:hypothetical protein [Vicinamibacterales bacterium]
MYIIRETFTARPGKASSLARLFKEIMADVVGLKFRVLSDYVGEFNTVVMETEVEDFAAFERMMAEYGARRDVRDKMKGYTDMYVTGRREVYKVV